MKSLYTECMPIIQIFLKLGSFLFCVHLYSLNFTRGSATRCAESMVIDIKTEGVGALSMS